MAIINLGVPEEMKRKVAELARAAGTSQTEMVKRALAEKLTVDYAARAEPETNIPS